MFDTKYKLTEISNKKRYNQIYENLEGKVCYLAYFKVGERGYFLFEDDDAFVPVHRIHTSVVKSVDFMRDGEIVVNTQNATYKFSEIKESE